MCTTEVVRATCAYHHYILIIVVLIIIRVPSLSTNWRSDCLGSLEGSGRRSALWGEGVGGPFLSVREIRVVSSEF